MKKIYGTDTKFLRRYYDNTNKMIAYWTDRLSEGYEVSLFTESNDNKKLDLISKVNIKGSPFHIENFIRSFPPIIPMTYFFKLQPGATGKHIAAHVKKTLLRNHKIFFCKAKSSDFEKAYFSGDYISGDDL